MNWIEHRLVRQVGLLIILLGSPCLAIPSAAQTTAYVGNADASSSHNDSVSVIDTSSNTVIATITGIASPHGIAVSPDGTHAYVTSKVSGSVSVIDTASNTVTGTILVGIEPDAVVVSPDGTRVYVGNQISNSVSVIDPASDTVIATVSGISDPSGLAVAPDGAHVFVGAIDSSSIAVIDTTTNSVSATIPVPNFYPISIAVTPDSTRAYVTLLGSTDTPAAIDVIDTATNQIIASISNGEDFDPDIIAITPDGSKAYVTDNDADLVDVIDTSSNTVLQSIAVGSEPQGLAVTPDGAHAYVTNSDSDSNSVSVIDTTSNTVSDVVTVGNNPNSVAIGSLNNSTVSLSPTSLTFPTTARGSFSTPQTITLTNIGSTTLTISSIVVSGSSGNFILRSFCGSTVAPGASCPIKVVFHPGNRGSITGTLTITDDAGDSPQTAALSGTGTVVGFSPTQLNFGSQAVGTSSAQQTVTLNNLANSPLNITAITIKGANPRDFSQTNTCGTGLAGGGSCSISVTFTPTKRGARSANISVTDSGGGSPQMVPLTGTGT